MGGFKTRLMPSNVEYENMGLLPTVHVPVVWLEGIAVPVFVSVAGSIGLFKYSGKGFNYSTQNRATIFRVTLT